MCTGIPCVLLADKGLPREFLGCLAVNSVIIVLTQISIFGLLVIALERYTAIRYPYDYCRRCTPRPAAAVIVGYWLAGILVGLVPMFGWNRGQSVSPRTRFIRPSVRHVRPSVNFILDKCPYLRLQVKERKA